MMKSISTNKHLLVFGMVLVLGMALRAILWQEPANSDDIKYFHFPPAGSHMARTASLDEINSEMANDVHRTPSAYRTSFGVPIQFWKLVFGENLTAFYSSVYFFGLLFGLSIGITVWVLVNPIGGVLALLLWATSPILIGMDTRLLPDNAGTAFALLSITFAWCARFKDTRWEKVFAIAAGATLYFSISARAGFVVFAVPVLIIVLSGLNWRRNLSLVFVGGVAVFVFEVLYYQNVLHVDFPKTRIESLLYKSSSRLEHAAFTHYSWIDMFTRYPKLLWASSKWDAILAMLGIIGCLISLAVSNDIKSRIKLAIVLFPVVFVLFAVVQVNPPVPVMREKLRYFGTLAPLLYVPVIELALFAMRSINSRIASVDANHIFRLIRFSPIAILGLLVICNFIDASMTKTSAIAGNRTLFDTTKSIMADAHHQDRAMNYFSDIRTNRVLRLMLPGESGWKGATIEPAYKKMHDREVRGNGYLILDWKRLNGNYASSFVGYRDPFNDTVIAQYHDIYRRLAIVSRKRYSAYITDAYYYKAGVPIDRDPVELPNLGANVWSTFDANTRNSNRLYGDYEWNGDDLLMTGDGLPWSQPDMSATSPSDKILEVSLDAAAKSGIAQIYGTIRWWNKEGQKHDQHMGRVYIKETGRNVRLWGYLPKEAVTMRVILRKEDDSVITLSMPKMFIMNRLSVDTFDSNSPVWGF